MFYVGQKVVCVDASLAWGRTDHDLREGTVYTILDVRKSPSVRSDTGVWVEVKSPHPLGGWCSSRFRPIVERKTDISIFTAMLTGNKQDVDA